MYVVTVFVRVEEVKSFGTGRELECALVWFVCGFVVLSVQNIPKTVVPARMA